MIHSNFNLEDVKEDVKLIENLLLNGMKLDDIYVIGYELENSVFNYVWSHSYSDELPQGYSVHENPLSIKVYDDIIEEGYIHIKACVSCEKNLNQIIDHVIYESKVSKKDILTKWIYGKNKVYTVIETIITVDEVTKEKKYKTVVHGSSKDYRVAYILHDDVMDKYDFTTSTVYRGEKMKGESFAMHFYDEKGNGGSVIMIETEV